MKMIISIDMDDDLKHRIVFKKSQFNKINLTGEPRKFKVLMPTSLFKIHRDTMCYQCKPTNITFCQRKATGAIVFSPT